MPARLVGVCREQGREVFVLAFEGQTDPASVQGVDHRWQRLGAVSDAVAALRDAGSQLQEGQSDAMGGLDLDDLGGLLGGG